LRWTAALGCVSCVLLTGLTCSGPWPREFPTRPCCCEGDRNSKSRRQIGERRSTVEVGLRCAASRVIEVRWSRISNPPVNKPQRDHGRFDALPVRPRPFVRLLRCRIRTETIEWGAVARRLHGMRARRAIIGLGTIAGSLCTAVQQATRGASRWTLRPRWYCRPVSKKLSMRLPNTWTCLLALDRTSDWHREPGRWTDRECRRDLRDLRLRRDRRAGANRDAPTRRGTGPRWPKMNSPRGAKPSEAYCPRAEALSSDTMSVTGLASWPAPTAPAANGRSRAWTPSLRRRRRAGPGTLSPAERKLRV